MLKIESQWLKIVDLLAMLMHIARKNALIALRKNFAMILLKARMTMERLTEYEVVGGHVHAVPTGDVDQAMMRLAAYEDLGFEPKEYKMAMSTDIIVRCAAAALGVPVEQLCEVVALGKAGRLMVLPEGGERIGGYEG